MGDVLKAKLVLESSWLQPLIQQPDITDISFNGEALYYQSSLYGRKPSTIQVSMDQVYHFIKQLANLMNVAFTYVDPLVDMSIDRYRIYAVGHAIGRKAYQPTVTFSIRIHPPSGFIPRWFIEEGSPWARLFSTLLSKNISLVIAGKTGSGKTQLQKELLTLMPHHQRLIVLDNILELDGLSIPHLDMTIWQVHVSNTLSTLVEAALRSNPDWLLIAEARGKEFKEIFRAVKTGHPMITTLHSDHLDGIYPRMVSMLLIEEQATMMTQFEKEIPTVFPVIIQLEKVKVHDRILRSIAAVQLRFPHKTFIVTPDTIHDQIEEILIQC